jgi:hypothetical protein
MPLVPASVFPSAIQVTKVLTSDMLLAAGVRKSAIRVAGGRRLLRIALPAGL